MVPPSLLHKALQLIVGLVLGCAGGYTLRILDRCDDFPLAWLHFPEHPTEKPCPKRKLLAALLRSKPRSFWLRTESDVAVKILDLFS